MKGSNVYIYIYRALEVTLLSYEFNLVLNNAMWG